MPPTNNSGSKEPGFWRSCPDCGYLAVAGSLLLVFGAVIVLLEHDAPGTTLFLFGCGFLLLAALWFRIEGPIRIGPFEATLRRQVIYAIREADVGAVRAIIPLLQSEEIHIALVRVPNRYAGKSLTEEELSFVRKQLQIQVIGLRADPESPWIAGGRISEAPWPSDGHLIVVGPRDTVLYFKALVAADSEELWRTVQGDSGS